MIDKHKQDLLDQYEDAAFALLMDEYAEKEGELLLKEYEEALAAGEVSDVPAELDQKCRMAIQKHYSKRHIRSVTQRVCRWGCRAAIFVVAILGISLTTILSVDAWRVPFLNYILKDEEHASVIIFDEPTLPVSMTEDDDILGKLLPDRYSQIAFKNKNGLIYSAYVDDANNYAALTMSKTEGEYYFDSEDATYTKTKLLDYDAVFRIENEYQIIWFDAEKEIAYSFVISGVSESDFWDISNILAESYSYLRLEDL